MSKGALSKPIVNFLRGTRKIALSCYTRRIVNGSFLRHIFTPVIALCHYVLLRKMGNTFVEMEISSICNSRCIFCSYVNITKTGKKLQVMNQETYSKVMEKLRTVNYEVISFTPTTGDTLVNSEWSSYVEQALDLAPTTHILLYTNGILMNEKNIEQLVQLLKKDTGGKIFCLLFSLGGYDKETYEYMFGVDKFGQVTENIKKLLARLSQEKSTLLVHLEFRIPHAYKVNLPTVRRELNPTAYPFLGVRVLREFLGIEGIERKDGLRYLEESCCKDNACAYLRKTRFAADGSIWADGCVVSELPGETTLKLGSVDDSWTTIEQNRKKIIDGWNKDKEIPLPCQKCTMYRGDTTKIKEDRTIPLWKDLY